MCPCTLPLLPSLPNLPGEETIDKTPSPPPKGKYTWAAKVISPKSLQKEPFVFRPFELLSAPAPKKEYQLVHGRGGGIAQAFFSLFAWSLFIPPLPPLHRLDGGGCYNSCRVWVGGFGLGQDWNWIKEGRERLNDVRTACCTGYALLRPSPALFLISFIAYTCVYTQERRLSDRAENDFGHDDSSLLVKEGEGDRLWGSRCCCLPPHSGFSSQMARL